MHRTREVIISGCAVGCADPLVQRMLMRRRFFRRPIESRGVGGGKNNFVYGPLGLSEAGTLGVFSELALIREYRILVIKVC